MLRSLPLDSPCSRPFPAKPNFPPPIWLMRQAGRYLPEYRAVRARPASFLDLCHTPELAAEVTLQPIDGSVSMRRSCSPTSWSCPMRWARRSSSRRARARARAGQRPAGFRPARYRPASTNALAPVYETIDASRQSCPNDVPLIGFCGAPWTVATYMIEGGGSTDQAAGAAVRLSRPGALQPLIDLLVEASADYLVDQVEAGADARAALRQLGREPAGGRVRALVHRADPRIVARREGAVPEAPVIGFPRGAGGYRRPTPRPPA